LIELLCVSLEGNSMHSENPTPEPAKPVAELAVSAKIIPKGLTAEDLVTLNEEIAGMARAGLPLDQGLAALAREMGRGRLQQVTAGIADDLKNGHTLPESLQRQGSRVPPFYAGLVAAGIRTGRISEVLATLTVYARSIADLRSIVIGSLYYPAIVLVLALALFGLLFTFLTPHFETVFHGFRIQLPAVTQFMIGVSHHFWEILAIPVVLIVVGFFVRLYLKHTERGRRAWARFVYAVPIVGTLIRSSRLAAFTDLLGILVDHGLPLPEAFGLAGAACSDPLLSAAAKDVQNDLSQGVPLGEVYRNRKLVPELIAWMTAMGEQRGSLGTTLHHVAELYKRQTEMRANLLRSVLPPLIILFTAAIITTLFVLGVGLPLLRLFDALSGGVR
jgi:type II secretory pathway component PulF